MWFLLAQLARSRTMNHCQLAESIIGVQVKLGAEYAKIAYSNEDTNCSS